MAEGVANTQPQSPKPSPANVGLAVGLLLGLLLALAEVTTSVRFENGPGFRYRVRVLGVVVFRFPEDGELFAMRPVPQASAARDQLVCASTFAGGVIGWVIGYVYGRRTRPRV